MRSSSTACISLRSIEALASSTMAALCWVISSSWRTAAPATPVRREDLAGRRLLVLLFDLSSMQPEDLDRAGRAAVDYVDHQMSDADLVAVASVDTTLTVVSDFTSDRQAVKAALSGFTAESVGALDGARLVEPVGMLNIRFAYALGKGTSIAPTWLQLAA